MLSDHSTFRFLLVDDSRAIQSIIRRAIESCGYEKVEIRMANDGEAAMETLDEFQPDLIITDWHMPKMSGLEFCQHVRQIHGTEMLIGFVTTEAHEDKIKQAHQNGAAFVMNKPFTDADFCATILNILPTDSKKLEATSDDNLIDLEKFKPLLKKYLPKQEANVIQRTPITLTDLTDSNLIGLYGFNRNAHPVAGIAIMDMKAVCTLWGIATNQSNETIQKLIANNTYNDEHLSRARELMEDLGPLVKMPAGKDRVGLTRASVLSRSFPRLKTVLESNSGRSDFTFEVPGFGKGIVTFVLV